MNQQSKQALEFYLTNKKMIWNLIIIIGIIVAVTSFIFIVQEINSAISFCDSVGGIYKIDSFTAHTCNSSPIYKYRIGGWSYPPTTFPID